MVLIEKGITYLRYAQLPPPASGVRRGRSLPVEPPSSGWAPPLHLKSIGTSCSSLVCVEPKDLFFMLLYKRYGASKGSASKVKLQRVGTGAVRGCVRKILLALQYVQ